ncbi:hypothetical protein [Escherichia coli]|uniref:hypothetical protein n=1 Tax=Escherichia coli TaxID=562 RepID=UPI000651A4BE|nr:hypothetical protein SK79_01208 [Escherichia coli]
MAQGVVLLSGLFDSVKPWLCVGFILVVVAGISGFSVDLVVDSLIQNVEFCFGGCCFSVVLGSLLEVGNGGGHSLLFS